MSLMLAKNFSRQHFEIFFLLFPRKQALAFHANCLLTWKTICMKCQSLFSWKNFSPEIGIGISCKSSPEEGDNLKKCQSLFSWKNKQSISNVMSAELAQRVVKLI